MSSGGQASRARPGMMEFNKESDYAGRKSASKRIDVTLMNRKAPRHRHDRARSSLSSLFSLSRGRQDKPIQLRAPVKRASCAHVGLDRRGSAIAGAEIK